MIISGLEKTSVIDYSGKVSCILFLHGCNFRCGFCHNPELVTGAVGETYSMEEIFDFLEKRKGKLDAVCITGGEPLLSLDFDFVRRIKEMGYLVKIDTNGSFPDVLRKLIDEKLVDYIAMDLKGSREKYSEIVGDVDLDAIEESMKLVSNFPESEFRTTIVSRFHDAGEIESMGNWAVDVVGAKPKNLFLQGFLNSGKLLDDSFKSERNVVESDLKNLVCVAEKYFENVGVRI